MAYEIGTADLPRLELYPSLEPETARTAVEAAMTYLSGHAKHAPLVATYGMTELTRRAEARASGRTPRFTGSNTDNDDTDAAHSPRPPIGLAAGNVIGHRREPLQEPAPFPATDLNLARRDIAPIVPLGVDDPWGGDNSAAAQPGGTAHPDPFAMFAGFRKQA